MSKLKEHAESRDKYEGQLVAVLSAFYGKFIRKVDVGQSRKDFQKELYKVATWSSSKKEREYSRFLKWCWKKHKVSEAELESWFRTVVTLYINVLLHRHPDGARDIARRSGLPRLMDVFYKGLKRTSRFFYEHPKSDLYDESQFERIAKEMIGTFMPLTAVVDYLEKHEDKTSEVSYNFDRITTSKSTKSSEISKDSYKEIVLQKASSNKDGSVDHNQLQYIPSDEFKNEYYESEQEAKETGEPHPDRSTDDKDVKQIQLPKVKVRRIPPVHRPGDFFTDI